MSPAGLEKGHPAWLGEDTGGLSWDPLALAV